MTPDKFIDTALEASIYAAPSAHGLSVAEINEVGARHGLRPGEISDALGRRLEQLDYDTTRYISKDPPTDFHNRSPEDPRNPEAFQFVMERCRELAREHGERDVRFERSALLHLADARSIPRHDVEVALAIYTLSGHLREVDPDTLRADRRMLTWATPRAQIAHGPYGRPPSYPELAKLLPTVRDVMARRSDGRSLHAEAVKAFAETLPALGCQRFRPWWDQLSAELSRADALLTPVTVIVLSAALLEGALCFVKDHATRLGASMSKGVSDEPKQWKFVHLIAAAKSGPKPIFDGQLGSRCLALNDHRQRIHAGRFWEEKAPGLQDLRPEEARDARATLDEALRKIIDWLQLNPPANGTP